MDGRTSLRYKLKLAGLIALLITVLVGLCYIGQFWLADGFAMMGVAAISFLLQFEDPVPLLRICAGITLLGGMFLFLFSFLLAASLIPKLVILALWAGAIVRTVVSWSRVN
jgi:hypothetical protein